MTALLDYLPRTLAQHLHSAHTAVLPSWLRATSVQSGFLFLLTNRVLQVAYMHVFCHPVEEPRTFLERRCGDRMGEVVCEVVTEVRFGSSRSMPASKAALCQVCLLVPNRFVPCSPPFECDLLLYMVCTSLHIPCPSVLPPQAPPASPRHLVGLSVYAHYGCARRTVSRLA